MKIHTESQGVAVGGAMRPSWGAAISVPLANVKRKPVTQRPEPQATDRGALDLAKDGKRLAENVALTDRMPSCWYDTPRNIYDGLSGVIRNRRALDQPHLRAIADDLDRRAKGVLPVGKHGVSSDVLRRTATALRNIAALSRTDFYNFLSDEATPVNHAELFAQHIRAEDAARDRYVDAAEEGR